MTCLAKLLQKITQLTNHKEEEALTSAFGEFMLEQFDLLQGVALYKLDQLAEDSMLSLQSCNAVTEENRDTFYQKTFQQSLTEILHKFLQDNLSLDDSFQSIEGHSLLIKRSNRDKTSIFFLVYELSKIDECQSPSACIPNALLTKNGNPQLQNIHSLSDIYTNHQTMIFLNDKDSLTGLYNRKSFDRRMHRCHAAYEHASRRSNDEEIDDCLAILDIDHFKRINDTYGHLYGDEVLLHFAQQMQKVFREEDGLFRYGGEEFIVILNNISLDVAEKVLHRFRQHIEAYPFPKVDKLTVSIGFTRLEVQRMQSEIVDQADHALYYAKEHGRNNVFSYEKLVQMGEIQEIITEDDIELF